MSKYWCLAAAGVALAAPVHAASDAAKKIGAREDVQQISLSPDGKRFVALLSDPKRGARAAVFTVDTTAPPLALIASAGEKEHLD
ncbi:hypothetical protein U1872_12265 [Sphingomonas sp. RB3P16]|uniref:hypothetical protein n=1 Tax=Parasphingomonas frigoris TaxID=3096163 RepID=UPI002FCBE32D